MPAAIIDATAVSGASSSPLSSMRACAAAHNVGHARSAPRAPPTMRLNHPGRSHQCSAMHASVRSPTALAAVARRGLERGDDERERRAELCGV